MRQITFAHGLRLVLAGLLMLALMPAASAQQPSRELQNLQELLLLDPIHDVDPSGWPARP